MATLLERFRAANPEYSGLDDAALADKAWERVVAEGGGGLSRSEFDAKVGLKASTPYEGWVRKHPGYGKLEPRSAALDVWAKHGQFLRDEEGGLPYQYDRESFVQDFLHGRRREEAPAPAPEPGDPSWMDALRAGVKSAIPSVLGSSARSFSHWFGGVKETIAHQEFERGETLEEARSNLVEHYWNQSMMDENASAYGRHGVLRVKKSEIEKRVDDLFEKHGGDRAKIAGELKALADVEHARRQRLGGEIADEHYEAVDALRQQAGTQDSIVREILFETPRTVGEMIPAVATAVLTRGASLLSMSTYMPIMWGHYADAALKEGRSMKDTVRKANVFAMVEGVTEKVPIDRFIRLGKDLQGRVLKSFALKGLEGGALESAQEMMVEGLEMAYDWGVFDEKTPLDEALRRIGHSGLLGFFPGAVIGGPLGAGRAAITKPEDVLEAGTTEEAIEAAQAAAEPAEEAAPAEDAAVEALGAVNALEQAREADPENVSEEGVEKAKESAREAGATEEDVAEFEQAAQPTQPKPAVAEDLEDRIDNLRETIRDLGLNAQIMDEQVLTALGPAIRHVREGGGNPEAVIGGMIQEVKGEPEAGTLGDMIRQVNGSIEQAVARTEVWNETLQENPLDDPGAPVDVVSEPETDKVRQERQSVLPGDYGASEAAIQAETLYGRAHQFMGFRMRVPTAKTAQAARRLVNRIVTSSDESLTKLFEGETLKDGVLENLADRLSKGGLSAEARQELVDGTATINERLARIGVEDGTEEVGPKVDQGTGERLRTTGVGTDVVGTPEQTRLPGGMGDDAGGEPGGPDTGVRVRGRTPPDSETDAGGEGRGTPGDAPDAQDDADGGGPTDVGAPDATDTVAPPAEVGEEAERARPGGDREAGEPGDVGAGPDRREQQGVLTEEETQDDDVRKPEAEDRQERPERDREEAPQEEAVPEEEGVRKERISEIAEELVEAVTGEKRKAPKPEPTKPKPRPRPIL